MWSKFDDKYDSNPKILEAGRDAKNLHEASIRWSNGHLTDGMIPKSALRTVGAAAQLPPRLHFPAALRLVAVGLFEDRNDRWFIHDFFEYNPTRLKVEADRAAAKERMQRTRSPEVPANKSRSSPSVGGMRTSPSPSRSVPLQEPPKGEPAVSQGLSESPVLSAPPTELSIPSKHDAVFSAWLKSTNRTGRTKLDAKRRKCISVALAGYPVEDVIDAVQGWAYSPHHRGENDRNTVFNELTLLLRDAAHIEKFRDLNRSNGRSRGGAARREEAPTPLPEPALREPVPEEISARIRESLRA